MKLVTSAKSLWKRPHEQPNVNIPFLQVPPEIIGSIATFLGPADIVLLSQTCRSMRTCLSKQSNATHLSCADYFAYLAGIARELTDQWVCDYCMALHPINKRDKPTTKRRPCSCPVHVIRASWRRNRLQNPHHIGIEHHHVQLALKYTRLQQRKYDSYLRALLEPYQKKPFDTQSRGLITHEARYSAYPRIVTGSDGNPRFLLFSIWRYLAGGRDIMLQHLGCQQICPHLQFRDHDYFQYNNDLLQTFLLALHADGGGVEWRSSCSRCATDFSVMLSGRNLYLQVWQDFGPEGSPLDLAWRSQNIRPGLNGVNNSAKAGPTLYHEAGSIRKLYGPAPEILPAPKCQSKWISLFPRSE
ncbi:hypothetical protein GGR58DRAFT_497432 [Xylaria digitata]|nr:hypothetical protein GGR58DRAFT_497432 [Xylaria digitata]